MQADNDTVKRSASPLKRGCSRDLRSVQDWKMLHRKSNNYNLQVERTPLWNKTLMMGELHEIKCETT